VIAGPCSVESREQIIETGPTPSSRPVRPSCAAAAYKPRTSPYAFQGLEEEGLELLKEACAEVRMPFVTEVMTIEQVNLVANRPTCSRSAPVTCRT